VRSAAEFTRLLGQMRRGSNLLLLVQRDGNSRFVVVSRSNRKRTATPRPLASVARGQVMPRRNPSIYEGIRNDTLAAYLHRIVRIPLLSKDDELELGRQIQRGTSGHFASWWRRTFVSWSRWPHATRAAACRSWT